MTKHHHTASTRRNVAPPHRLRSIGDRPHRSLALAALRQALAIRRPQAGLIHHSDGGSQCRSIHCQAELRRHGVQIPMSGKGNCHDNAMVETFLKSLKSELVWRTALLTRAEAKGAIGRCVESFHNPVRRHAALDFVSPAACERQAAQRAASSPLKRGKSSVARMLEEADADLRAHAQKAILQAIQKYDGPKGICSGGSIWLLSTWVTLTSTGHNQRNPMAVYQ